MTLLLVPPPYKAEAGGCTGGQEDHETGAGGRACRRRNIPGDVIAGNERTDDRRGRTLAATVHIATGTRHAVESTEIALLVGLRESVAAVRQCAVAETRRAGIVAVVVAVVALLGVGIDDGVPALRQARPLAEGVTVDAGVAVEFRALIALLAEAGLDDRVAAEALDELTLGIAGRTRTSVVLALVALFFRVHDVIAAGEDNPLTGGRARLTGQAVEIAVVTLLACLQERVAAICVGGAGVAGIIRTEGTKRSKGTEGRTVRAGILATKRSERRTGARAR